ncbi:WSC domain-containing protein 2 [Cytospora mali]|uniref:WSC domain-containing protein 2 n=1 Tax=Cytospora mali TaxID=578113 RepID=A0A194VF46_CYTMA|nr:WSC domain-containing protein 2 [Valsa mali var. pyri (nom. inval.)]
MARTVTSIPLTCNLALTALILLTSIPTSPAQQQPTVYTNSLPYSYIGCYHETTDLPNTNGARALNDGKVWVGPEYMTVPMCLGFCGGGSGDVYNYAGLEYSRECWCAKTLNGLAVKLDDSACTLQCDGDATQLCGGSLKLSLRAVAVNWLGPWGIQADLKFSPVVLDDKQPGHDKQLGHRKFELGADNSGKRFRGGKQLDEDGCDRLDDYVGGGSNGGQPKLMAW